MSVPVARYPRSIGEGAKRRKKARRQHRRASVRERILGLARELFGGTRDWPADDPRWDHPAGGVGVREALRPRLPTLSGAVALDEPPPEMRDTRAVAEGEPAPNKSLTGSDPAKRPSRGRKPAWSCGS
jgi:hypothetical protein